MMQAVILPKLRLGLTVALLALCAPASARFTEDFGERPEAAATAFEKGKAAVTAKDWFLAVREFRAAIAETPADADAWSMLGFSLRKSGQAEAALAAYDRALSIDPAHRDALSYLGKAHLQLGEPRRAEALLPRLEAACRSDGSDPGMRCPALDDLTEAIAAHAAGRSKDVEASGW